MPRTGTICGILVFIALTLVEIGFTGGDEDRKHGEHHGKGNGHHGDAKRLSEHDEESLKPVSNAVYKEKCGSCHFAYQPELLVSEGWRQIIWQSDNHFGESVDLSAEEKKEIESYLLTNAAEKSSSEISRKITRCLGQQIPMRITEIPYIVRKHREVKPIIVKGGRQGSLSNCSACHKRAEQGYYDDADE